jgi:hypothetical protein
MNSPDERREPEEPGISVNPVAPEIQDGRDPLPGPLKRADGKRNPSMVPRAIKGGKDRYLFYGKALIKNGGNRAYALRDVFGLDHDPNMDEEQELHDRLLAEAGKEIPLKRILESSDLTDVTLATVIASHVYSDHPAASLKGIEIARDMLAKSGSASAGATFEDYLMVARAKLQAKKADE